MEASSLEKESKTGLMITLPVVFISLSTVGALARLYTRTRILKIGGIDDVTISIAQVLAIAVSINTILQGVWGIGKHTPFVPPADATKANMASYANMLIYNLAQTVTKISFLFQYRRLFADEVIQRICFGLLLFITGWGILQEFLVGFTCMPLTLFVPRMAGKCIYPLIVWYLTSAMNIVTDFAIFFIPIVPVAKLHISLKRKFLVLGLFGLGFFTCIISIVRLFTLYKGVNTTDPFWDNTEVAYWSVVELNCGILCACLPTLRPLVQKLVPKLVSTIRRSGTSDGTGMAVGSLAKQKHRVMNVENGHSIHREIEFHSQSELRDDTGKDRLSVECSEVRSEVRSVRSVHSERHVTHYAKELDWEEESQKRRHTDPEV